MFDMMEVWQEILKILENDLADITFNTWIEPLKPLMLTDSEFVILAPNGFNRKIIETRHMTDIEMYVEHILKKPIAVRITDPSDETYDESSIQTYVSNNGQLSFGERETLENKSHFDKKTDKKDDYPFRNQQVLNPKYTFDTFIKGKSNELALAAAKAVAKNPSKAYNPLFIWGGPGLGKTHLMQAIAHEIFRNNPKSKVVYISSETFTNELISSIGDRSTKRNAQFRDKYRNIDVLLIDDIQFIAGKQGTQEEFFHTFNDLYGQNKQIIISSDRPPKEIKTLEERLVSRFEWGLMADIQIPDYETRMAILETKRDEMNKDIPREILEYIAMNVENNIRELEGVWLRLLAYLDIHDLSTIDMKEAKIALNNVLTENRKKPITIELIKEIVANTYSISIEEMESKQRTKTIAYPRQIAMYLVREMTDLSLIKIAESFNRDHSTIMHGIEKINKDINQSESFKAEITALKDKVNNY